jgi:hypothetical protein
MGYLTVPSIKNEPQTQPSLTSSQNITIPKKKMVSKQVKP